MSQLEWLTLEDLVNHPLTFSIRNWTATKLSPENSTISPLYIIWQTVVAVGLTQDLTLILSTKNKQAKQTNKTSKQTKQTNKQKMNSSTAIVSGPGFIVKNICCVLLPATTSLKMPIMEKKCSVLLPAS